MIDDGDDDDDDIDRGRHPVGEWFFIKHDDKTL